MKISTLDREKFRVRNKLKKVSSKDRFRLCVSRSTENISAQIIDDTKIHIKEVFRKQSINQSFDVELFFIISSLENERNRNFLARTKNLTGRRFRFRFWFLVFKFFGIPGSPRKFWPSYWLYQELPGFNKNFLVLTRTSWL